MSSIDQQILSNSVENVNTLMSREQSKEIDNIFKDTYMSLLKEFPESLENEKPSEEDLNDVDNALENAIRLLSESESSFVSRDEDIEQARRFNDIESFLKNYESK